MPMWKSGTGHQYGILGRGAYLRGPGPAGAGLLERAEEQSAHDVYHDVVQQEARDHIVHFELGLENGRDERPEPACKKSGDDDHGQDHDGRNALEGDPEHRGCERSCEELALGTDVPELGPERKGNGKPREKQRARLDKGFQQIEPRAQGSVKQIKVGLPEFAACNENGDGGEDEGRQHCGNGNDDPGPPGKGFALVDSEPHSFLTPLIQRPICSLDASSIHGFSHHLPFEKHENPVTQGEDFIQVFRDEQDCRPALPFLQDPLMHVLHGAHIQAAGGLAGDQDRGFARPAPWPASPSAGFLR